MKRFQAKRDAAALNSRLVRRPIQRMVWLFLLPTFAAFCIGFIYPFLKGAFLSFCKFKLTSKWTWVGFDNYLKAFADSSFRHAFLFTALFAFVSVLFINALAFAVAYALTRGIKGSNLFRTVFFMPNLIGGIVLGYIWSMIFDGFLVAYGQSVVLNSHFGFWGLIILLCWQQVGYMMIIYIAGLQSVPEDMLEAARIDGATNWQTLWKVTIPNMMSSFTICFFLTAALTASQTAGGYAPFALGCIAAAGPGADGAAALLGGVTGALLFLDFQQVLALAAVGILILTAATAFRDTAFLQKPWVLPVLAAGMVLAVGGIYVLQSLDPLSHAAPCAAASAFPPPSPPGCSSRRRTGWPRRGCCF